jgi:hypothetical protein
MKIGESRPRFNSFPTGRALLTKMVEPEEVPKMYGALQLSVAIVGLAAIPGEEEFTQKIQYCQVDR